MNLNIKSKKANTYDAIVVGTGISGGWAAKELCEKGLKTLVLERGRNIKHVVDYPTMNKDPWELPNGDQPTIEHLEKVHPVLGKYSLAKTKPSVQHWYPNDHENPYIEKKGFGWIRGYHVGGKSLMWGKQSYRLSDLDFEANTKEGLAVDWPIRYKDIAPWYDYVETFAGISGQKEGLAHLPDGKFLPPMDMNCVEKHVSEKIRENFENRIMTIGRTAMLTQPHNGRGKCQYRNRCKRGCPYGAYFSSNSATLPAAEVTGNMELKPNSIVNRILYDENNQKATGVKVIDSETNEIKEYYAKIIFLNASTLGSTYILLNSISNRFPNGLGNDSGELGHNLMDHHFSVGASGEHTGFKDSYYSGRRANGIYIPRYRNITTKETDYIRGFGYQGGASREDWRRGIKELGFGAGFKDNLTKPGTWKMGLVAFGECLPYHKNQVALTTEKKDKWGQAVLEIDCEFGDNERAMRKHMANDAAEMLEASGLKKVNTFDNTNAVPGLGIHEMGTARMGKNPETSVLNAFNQVHACKNVFVTDGACMTSSACQNPSLTYMALTARAADYAVRELKKGNL